MSRILFASWWPGLTALRAMVIVPLGLAVSAFGIGESPDYGNDVASATPITLAGDPATFTGTIYPAGDVDCVSVMLTAGQSYTIRSVGDSSLNIRLQKPDGTVLVGPQYQVIAYTPTTTGSYVIRLDDYNGTCNKGYFAVKVATYADDHANSVSAVLTADQLDGTNRSGSGSIEIPDDSDYFTFAGTPGKLYELDYAGIASVVVYSAAGALLDSGNRSRFIAGAGQSPVTIVFSTSGNSVGVYGFSLREVEMADIALTPITTTATPARDAVSLDPGKTFVLTAGYQVASGTLYYEQLRLNCQMAPVGGGSNITLASLTDTVPSTLFLFSRTYSSWYSNSVTFSKAGTYRISLLYQAAVAGGGFLIDDASLTTPGAGGTVVFSEGFEHAGSWGTAGWIRDGNGTVVQPAVDGSVANTGSYSAGTQNLAAGNLALLQLVVTVPIDGSIFSFSYLGLSSTGSDSFQMISEKVVGAGSGGSLSGTITVPSSTIAGTYNIVTTLNDAAGFGDTNSANDSQTSDAQNQVTVNAKNFPDLVPTAIARVARDATVAEGDVFDVTFTVANQGAAIATGPWPDRISLINTDSGNLCQASYTLRTVTYAGSPLDAASRDTAYTKTVSVTVPSGSGGSSYWLAVRTDSSGVLPEGTGEANNFLVATGDIVTVTVPARPNVITTAVAIDNPTPLLGQPVRISVTTGNSGTVAFKPSQTTNIYLSSDSAVDGYYDQLLATMPSALLTTPIEGSNALRSGAIATGQTSGIEKAFTAPAGGGDISFRYFRSAYYYDNLKFEVVDSGNNVVHTKSFTNTYTTNWTLYTYHVTTAGAYTARWRFTRDFYSYGSDAVMIDDLTFPDASKEGFEGGTLPTGWQQAAGTVTPFTVVNLNATVAPEATRTDMMAVRLPTNLAPGAYWLVIRADSGRAIIEGDTGEFDNDVAGLGTLAGGFGTSITIAAPPHPDLVASNVTVAPAAREDLYFDQDVNVSWTVTNTGDYPAVPANPFYGSSDYVYLTTSATDKAIVKSSTSLGNVYNGLYNSHSSTGGIWRYDSVYMSQGTHTVAFVYWRPVGSPGTQANTVSIDRISFPGGAGEQFSGPGLPSGWATGGDAVWSFDNSTGDDSLGGSDSTALSATLATTTGLAVLTTPAFTVAASGYLDYAYKSDIASGDYLLVYVDGVLLPGQSEVRKRSVTVPAVNDPARDGQRWFAVSVDHWDDIEEFGGDSDGSNIAIAATASSILEPPHADLVVNSVVTTAARADYSIGDLVDVTWSVSNIGSLPAVPVYEFDTSSDVIHLTSSGTDKSLVNSSTTVGSTTYDDSNYHSGSGGYWYQGSVSLPPGEHAVAFVWRRNSNYDTGYADAVWLDNVEFPDGTVEAFSGPGLPAGWLTGGHAAWTFDGTIGATGGDSTSLRTGVLTAEQISVLSTPVFTNTAGGTFTYSYRTDTSYGDRMFVYVDGVVMQGQTRNYTQTVQVPDVEGVSRSAERWFAVAVDANNDIYESSGDNDRSNIGIAAASSTISIGAQPDLAITVDSVSPNPSYWGATVTVDYTVTNNGQKYTPSTGGWSDRIYLSDDTAVGADTLQGSTTVGQYNYISGFQASYWNSYYINVTPGKHVFTWAYVRDDANDGGDNTFWLDDITFPTAAGDETESFEGAGGFDLAGWQTAGNADWSVDDQTSNSGNKSRRAGAVGHSGISALSISKTVTAGYVTFYYRGSSELYDRLYIYVDGMLLPGQSYSGRTTFNMPEQTADPATVRVLAATNYAADGTYTFKEYTSTADNYAFSGALTVNSSPSPDLQVTDIAFSQPGAPVAGDYFWDLPLTVRMQVTNVGSEAIALPWEDRVEYRKAGSGSFNDLGSHTGGTMPLYASYTDFQDWTKVELELPAGKHRLRWRYTRSSGGSGDNHLAWIDDIAVSTAADGQVAGEDFEGVTVPALPDNSAGLGGWSTVDEPWVTVGSVGDPQGHNSDVAAQIGQTLADGASGDLVVDVTLTADSTVSFWYKLNQYYYDSLQLDVQDVLEPGASLWRSITGTIGNSTSPDGTYEVRAIADYNNVIAEFGAGAETNNTLVSTVVLRAPPLPDLRVREISSLPPQGFTGESFAVGAVIENIGSAPAIGSFYNKLYLVNGAGTSVSLTGNSGDNYMYASASSEVYSQAVSADGATVALGFSNGVIELYNSADGTLIRQLPGHLYAVTALSFSPDGSRLASASSSQTTAKVWNVSTGALEKSYTDPNGSGISDITFSPDGSRIACATYYYLRVWTLADDTRADIGSGNDGYYTVRYNSNGTQLLSGTNNLVYVAPDSLYQTKLWNVADGTLIRSFNGTNSPAVSAEFSPDNSQILVAGGYEARLLNVADGALLQTFVGHTSSLLAAQFSPDGTQVATGSYDRTIRIWNKTTGAVVRDLGDQGGAVRTVRYVPQTARTSFALLLGGGDNSRVRAFAADGSVVRNFFRRAFAVSDSFTLGSFADGDYTLRLYVDAPYNLSEAALLTNRGAVFEAADGSYIDSHYAVQSNNNIYSHGAPVQVTFRSEDLVIGNISVPANAAWGSTVPVTYTITNADIANGGIANRDLQAAFSNRILFSTNGTTFADAAFHYIPAGGSFPLAPGASAQVTVDVDIPVDANVGYIWIMGDAFSQTNEQGAAKNNNTATSGALTFTVPNAPDLITLVDEAHPFSFPTDITPLTNFAFSWYQLNQTPPADADADQFRTDGLYLSADETLNTDTDKLIADPYVSAVLAPGDSVEVAGTDQMSNGEDLPPGDYFVFVRTDRQNSQLEKNDGAHGVDNNTYQWSSPARAAKTVRVHALDLEPISLVTPDQLAATVDHQISWTVRNNGDGDIPAGTGWSERIYLSKSATFSTGNAIQWSEQYYAAAAPIAAGTSYSRTVSLPFPTSGSITPGPWYVHIWTDTNDTIPEYDVATGAPRENNNTYPRPGTVQVVVPDLVVKSITGIPATVSRGTTTAVTVTLKNQNAGEAGPSWYDQLYLVASTGTATPVATQYHATPIVAGGELAYSFEFTVPASLANGSYRVRVTTDIYDYINEFSDQNNSRTAPAVATDAGTLTVNSADLVPVALTSPGAIMAGNDLAVTWTIENHGGGATPQHWYDQIVLSDKSTWNQAQSDPNRATGYYYHDHAGIPSGGSMAFSGSIYLPFTVDQDGDKQVYLYLVADSSDSVGEEGGGAGNNTVARTGAITIGIFDLTVTSPDGTGATATVGPFLSGDKAVTISWIVANSGNVATSATWRDALYFSTNRNSSVVGDILLGTHDRPNDLEADGDSYTRSALADMPAWNPAWDGQTLYVKVIADSGSAIAENDENNNIGIYTLLLTEKPAVDLEVTAVSDHNNAKGGDTVTVVYDITNNSTGVDAIVNWQDALYLAGDAGSRPLGSVNHSGATHLESGTAGWKTAITVPVQAGRHTMAWVFYRIDSFANSNSAMIDNVILPLAAGDASFNFSGGTLPSGFVAAGDNWQIVTGAHGGGDDAVGAANVALGDAMVLTYTGDFAEGEVVFDANIAAHYLSFHEDYAIPAGESRTFRKTFTVPFQLSGTYRIAVQADATNVVAEPGREGNNTGTSADFNILLGPYADLAIDAPPVRTLPVLDADVTTGSMVTVRWTVTNHDTAADGASTSAGWSDFVYLSDVATLAINAEPIGAVPHRAPLGREESYSADYTFRLEDGLASAKYIFVRTNGRGDIFENGQTDNNVSAALPLNILQGPYPDLLPTTILAPDNVKSGSRFDLAWQVENAGTASLNGAWLDQVWLSQDQILDGADTLLATSVRNGSGLPATTDPQNPSFYAAVEPVEIPRTVSGTWYFIVRTDSGNNLFELNANGITDANVTNNILVQAVQITVPPSPNLIVTQTQIETLGREDTGQYQLTVVYTIKNEGTASTGTAQWFDAVYLSTTLNAFGDTEKLLETSNQSYLEPGESYTQTVEITVPWEFAEGDYYVLIQADSRDQVFEYQAEGDNYLGGTTSADETVHIDFRLQPQPYLGVLSSYTGPGADTDAAHHVEAGDPDDIVLSKEEYAPGDQISGFWTSVNSGNANLKNTSWDDAAALSTDPYFSADDVWLGSHKFHTPGRILAPGEKHRFTEEQVMENRIPGNQPVGLYYLLIISDTHGLGTANSSLGGGLDFVNIRGNVAVYKNQIRILERAPSDLVGRRISAISSPTNAAPVTTVESDSWLYPSWRTENYGYDTTSETYWNDSVYLSRDAVLDDGDTLIVTERHDGPIKIVPTSPSLRNDWFYENSGGWQVPINLVAAPTQFYLIARVGDGVNETYLGSDNKANNVVVSTSPITITPHPASDLEPTALSVVTAPGLIKQGNMVTVRWTVQNTGAAATNDSSWQDTLAYKTVADPTTQTPLTKVNHIGVLSPGASYIAEVTFALPENTPASIQFLVTTADGRRIYESSYSNNSFIGQQTSVQEQILPELAVTAHGVVQNPATAVSGTYIDYSFTVTNSSADTWVTRRAWTDQVFLSSDAILDSGDKMVLSRNRSTGLAAGKSYDVSGRIDLDIDLSGVYYLFVRTDVENQVLELNEINNDTAKTPDSFTVTLSDTADLQTTGIDISATSPSVVNTGSIASVLSGQRISGLSYTVKNFGAKATGPGLWHDSIYLSRDRYLDGDDPQVATVQRLKALANGESYTVNGVEFIIPAGLGGDLYIIVKADATKTVHERNAENNNWRPTGAGEAFRVIVPPKQGDPSYLAYNYDLQVNSVTVSLPAGRENVAVQPGQLFTVSWTGTNTGTGTIYNAQWNDGIYVSLDNKWDINDTFVASLPNAPQTLTPNDTYTASMDVPLPAVNEATYYIIVRTDIRQNVIESNEMNNATASAMDNRIDTAIPILTDNTAGTLLLDEASVTQPLATGESHYYRVDVEAGAELEIDLTCTDPAAATELFVKFGAVPSAVTADYFFSKHFEPNQRITIPGTREGSYYILVRGDNVPNAQLHPAFTLRVKYLVFSATTITPPGGGNAGRVTTLIEGAKFTPDTIPSLVAPGGTAYPAVEKWFESPSIMHATFDLNGAATGVYHLQLTDATQTAAARSVTATLPSAFTVTTGLGGQLKLRVIAPAFVRTGVENFAYIEYGNRGDQDIVAPVIQVQESDRTGVQLRLNVTDEWSNDYLQLLAYNQDGPADRLPPGASFALPIRYRLPDVGHRFIEARVVDTMPGNVDYTALEAELRGSLMSDATAAAMMAYLQSHYGNDFASYADGIRADGLRRWLQGAPTSRVSDLINFAARVGIDLPVSAVSGYLRYGTSGAVMAGEKVFFSGPNGSYGDTTDAQGRFLLSGIPAGTYDVLVEGYLVKPGRTITLTRDTDITGLMILAYSQDTEEETDTLPPNEVSDGSPSLVTGPDGTVHLAWQRASRIWQAEYDPITGTFLPGAADSSATGAEVPGIDGREPRLLPWPAADAAGGNGLMLIYRNDFANAAGSVSLNDPVSHNRSSYSYAFGCPAAPGDGSYASFNWSAPGPLTAGGIGDYGLVALADPADATKLILTFMQRDWSTVDDGDLYSEAFSVDNSLLDTYPAAREIFPLPDLSLSAGRDLNSSLKGEICSVVNIQAGFTIPGRVPLISGRYALLIKGTPCVSLQSEQCQTTLSAKNFRAEAEITSRFKVVGEAELSAVWTMDKERCKTAHVAEWGPADINGSLGIGAEVRIPAQIGFLPGPLVAIYEIGSVITVGGKGQFGWKGGTPFFSLPNTGGFELQLGGGVYGTVKFLDAEANIVGINKIAGGWTSQDKWNVTFGQTFSADITKWKLNYKLEFEWKSDNLIGRQVGRSMELTADDEIIIRDSGEGPARAGSPNIILTIRRQSLVGLDKVYKDRNELLLENPTATKSDRVTDLPADMARSAAGEVLAVWSKESSNTKSDTGTYLKVASYANGAWTVIGDIDLPAYYASQPRIEFDSNGDPWVFFARADVSFVNQTTGTDAMRRAFDDTDIYYSRRSGGTWSAPVALAQLVGTDSEPAVAAGPDGALTVAWVNRPDDTRKNDHIIVRRFDGAAWSDGVDIVSVPAGSVSSPKPAVADPTVAYSGASPVIAWSHQFSISEMVSGQLEEYSTRRIGFTYWDANLQSWQNPEFLAKSVFVPVADDVVAREQANEPEAAPGAYGYNGSGPRAINPKGAYFRLPWKVPDSCCMPEPDPDKPNDPKEPKKDPKGPDDGGGGGGGGGAGASSDGVKSHDPNEKRGPAGVGEQHAISALEAMTYTILFENFETATAPASLVIVTDVLPAGLDVRRFRLKEVGFANQVFAAPENRPFWSTSVNLANGMRLDISAGISPATRTATWVFRTIDPKTGQAPVNPILGFLPPNTRDANNDKTGIGEGYVSFTILPAENVADGDVITNQATIFFDENEAIVTNTTSHLISDTAYDSTVLANFDDVEGDDATVDADTITVRWALKGTSPVVNLDQDGAGFDIYVSEQGAPFRIWQSNTKEQSATMAVRRGLNYRFYSLVHDAAGNVEALPVGPDAAVRILHGNVAFNALLSYAGRQPGDIKVQVFSSDKGARAAFDGTPVGQTSFTSVQGPYQVTFADLQGEGKYYHLRAWIDANGNNMIDSSEAYGELADVDPVGKTSPMAVAFSMADPDTDADGLPDWWEMHFFSALSQRAYGDPDHDGIPNIVEYRQNTAPNDDNDKEGRGLSTGSVGIAAGQLLVDGSPFRMRAVSYDPVAPGTAPAGSDIYNDQVINRDVSNLIALGVNTVRLKRMPSRPALLDALHAAGIKVIAGFPIAPATDAANAAARDAVIAEFSTLVNTWKAHPAILAWCIGDDGLELSPTATAADWFGLYNELAWASWNAEGDAWHPVTASVAGLAGLAMNAAEAGGIDMWGIAWSGLDTFTTGARVDSNLFADYAALGLRQPMWVSAAGVDAWDATLGILNETRQARALDNLLTEFGAAAGKPGTYDAVDAVIAAGTAAYGTAGTASVAFVDADGNGIWSADEDTWRDVVISRDGSYENGYDGLIAGTVSDGAAGSAAAIAFLDLDGDRGWDANEPVWVDQNTGSPISASRSAADRIYDDGVDEVIYGTLTVGNDRSLGRTDSLYLVDADKNGAYTAGEGVWGDRFIGSRGVYDAIDTAVLDSDSSLVVGQSGISTGVWLSADGTAWSDRIGGAVGICIHSYIDAWWPVGPIDGHDIGSSITGAPSDFDDEFFGLAAEVAGDGTLTDPRPAAFVLRHRWSTGSSSAALPQVVVTDEDTPVNFFPRTWFDDSYSLALERAEGALFGTVDNFDGTARAGAATYTPPADFAGTDRIDYTVLNPAREVAARGEIIIIISPVDDSPQNLAVSRDSQTVGDGTDIVVDEAADLNLLFQAVEVDGQAIEINYTITAPGGASLTGAVLSDMTAQSEDLYQRLLAWKPSLAESSRATNATYTLRVYARDIDGGSAEVEAIHTLFVVNVNQLPTADGVVVAGGAADTYTKDAITLNYVYGDPDEPNPIGGDPEDGTRIRWYRSTAARVDEPMTAYDGMPILPATATTKGDSWYAVVEPSDDNGSTFGAPVASTPITIRNSSPTVVSLAITSSDGTPRRSSTLGVALATADDDNDAVAVTGYRWQQGATVIAEGGDVSQLSNAARANTFRKGEVTLTVTVSDGDADPNNSNSDSTVITIANTPPVIDQADISVTAPARVLSTFAALQAVSDADLTAGGEQEPLTVTYEWLVNGTGTGVVDTALVNNPANRESYRFVKGDTVSLRITVQDDTDTTVTTTAAVTVVDTPPAVPVAGAITPANPDSADDLSVTGAIPGNDPDPQDTVELEYRWSTDGAFTARAVLDGAVLGNIHTAYGERWYAQARSHTTDADSDWVTQNSVLVAAWQQVSLGNGWNPVSLYVDPSTLPDTESAYKQYSSVFLPTDAGSGQRVYRGVLTTVADKLSPLEGLLLYRNQAAAGMVQVPGMPLAATARGTISVPLYRGWNLIGPPATMDLPTDAMITNGTIEGPIFVTDPATGHYVEVTGANAFEKGKAYWVYIKPAAWYLPSSIEFPLAP